jgi:hypothetical protein
MNDSKMYGNSIVDESRYDKYKAFSEKAMPILKEKLGSRYKTIKIDQVGITGILIVISTDFNSMWILRKPIKTIKKLYEEIELIQESISKVLSKMEKECVQIQTTIKKQLISVTSK